MPYTVAAKNLMLAELKEAATYVSLHSSEPDSSGSGEITGGDPAYARQEITWADPSNGVLDSSNTPVFDVPGGTTVRYVGVWSASTSGTFLGYGPVAEETFGEQGTYTLTDGDLDLNT